MAQPVIQASFNSGEWSPHLYARVDIQKYHSGAALLRNFFVDYRGGASTRSGSKYVLQAFKSATAVRLIPFQASLTVRYMLEFGDHYIRFHQNGAPVLEAATTITAANPGPPEAFVDNAHGYSNGDWVMIENKYYVVQNVTANAYTLQDLFGINVNGNPFTIPAQAKRVFTLVSPYAAADLIKIRFCQNVDVLFLCHQSYVPYNLTFTSATSWLLAPISFGSTIGNPTNALTATTLSSGAVNYSYLVTAVDSNGQESDRSTVVRLNALQDLRTTVGANSISWTGVAGATSYNVYKSDLNVNNPVPDGVPFGFIGNCTGTTFSDANIAADFSQAPPISQNPFAPGSIVQSVTITAIGSYTSSPTVTFGAPPAGGTTATASVIMSAITAAPSAAGTGYVVGNTIVVGSNTILQVTTIGVGGSVTGVQINNVGVYTGSLPANPLPQISTSGSGTGATFTLTWGVLTLSFTNSGSGYLSAPAVTFSAGAATGTAVLGPDSAGNPGVPAFFQQRFVLASTANSPQVVFMSQPGNYYNFDVSSPIQASDAITANIVSGQLNNIKSLVPQPGGLIVLTDGASFLINGGSLGAVVTPSSVSANAQSFLGCNDMPPIVSNYDILYVQSKGSSVRDASYNFYANVFTGNDISIIASHLFFGYQLLEWAWADEPYKIVWAVRNDGKLLSLTFLKEQDFTGWAHHDTNGLYKSVAAIVEPATVGFQSFVYVVVERTVQAQTLKYIEYFPERLFPNGVQDAVTVDCAYQYSGAPATSFSGATALAGLTCTGLADGVIIPSFVMAADGSFTLGVAASKVTVGLSFTPQLQTLYLDTGDPTIQSKMKKINAGTVRVTDTLGLQIGTDFNNLVDMKDLVRGNVGTMTNTLVTDLVTGDARTFLDPKWQEQGQYCIQQSYPYPATILGVVPQLTVGDTPK